MHPRLSWMPHSHILLLLLAREAANASDLGRPRYSWVVGNLIGLLVWSGKGATRNRYRMSGTSGMRDCVRVGNGTPRRLLPATRSTLIRLCLV